MTTEIKRGSEDDRKAFQWAAAHQGFAGSWQDWLDLPLAERVQYEEGAACGDEPRKVTDRDPVIEHEEREARIAFARGEWVNDDGSI